MELRSLILVAFVMGAALLQCSDAHTMRRREAHDDVNYDELADEAGEDDTQNDTEVDTAEEEKPEIPATILTKPTNYEVTLGRTVRLECNVTPNTTVVQWFKDKDLYFIGSIKAGDQDDRFSIIPDAKDLLIRDLSVTDSGVYRCETAQNRPVAINHTVVVLESPRILRFDASDNGTVVEGSDLLLTCDVAGSPAPQIVWSREGDKGNERLQERDGEFSVNSVFIKNIKSEQAGKYYCYAFNSAGNNQAEKTVTVLSKPRVHVHKTVVNSAINVEAVLECSVHAGPAPHIRWYKDNKLIEDSSSQFSMTIDGARSNLTVIPRSNEDFGTFTCEAENAHGKHNRSARLVAEPVVELVSGGAGAALEWRARSHQPLLDAELQLIHTSGESDVRTLSVPLPEAKGHVYDFVYVLQDKQLDAGQYEAYVKVKNENGWSGNTEPVIVEIQAQPEYIQHASVYRGNSHSLRPVSFLATVMYLLVRTL